MLTKEMIVKTFPNIDELVGSSLFISVSVLTETGKTSAVCINMYIILQYIHIT